MRRSIQPAWALAILVFIIASSVMPKDQVQLYEVKLNNFAVYNLLLNQIPPHLFKGDIIDITGKLLDENGQQKPNTVLGIQDGLGCLSTIVYTDAFGEFTYRTQVRDDTYGPRNLMFIAGGGEDVTLLNFAISLPQEDILFSNQYLFTKVSDLNTKYPYEINNITVTNNGTPYWVSQDYLSGIRKINCPSDVNKENYNYVLQQYQQAQTDPWISCPGVLNRAFEIDHEVVAEMKGNLVQNILDQPGPFSLWIYLGGGALCAGGLLFPNPISGAACASVMTMAKVDIALGFMQTVMEIADVPNDYQKEAVETVKVGIILVSVTDAASFITEVIPYETDKLILDSQLENPLDVVKAGYLGYVNGSQPFSDASYVIDGDKISLTFSYNNKTYVAVAKTEKAIINVTEPGVSSIWTAGQPASVRWSSEKLTGNVDILFSTDGGETFPVVLASNIENDGLEEVVVPSVASNECRIQVRSIENERVRGINPGAFSIIQVSSSLTLTISPNPANTNSLVHLSVITNPVCPNYPINFFKQTGTDGTLQNANPILTDNAGVAQVDFLTGNAGNLYLIAVDGRNADNYDRKLLQVIQSSIQLQVYVTANRVEVINNKVRYKINVRVTKDGEPFDETNTVIFQTDFGLWETSNSQTLTVISQTFTSGAFLLADQDGTAHITINVEGNIVALDLPIQYSIPPLQPVRIIPAQGVESCSFSPTDDKLVYNTSNMTVQVYDYSQNEVVHDFPFITPGRTSQGEINVARFSPDGSKIFACGNGSHILDAASGASLAANRAITLNSSNQGDAHWLDNSTLIANYKDYNNSYSYVTAVLNAANLAVNRSILGSDYEDITFGVGGSYVVMATQQTSANAGISFLYNRSSWSQIWAFNPPGNGDHFAADISPDGTRTAIGDDYDHNIFIINSSNGQSEQTLSEGRGINSIAWNPVHAQYIAALQGAQLKIWDLTSYSQIGATDLSSTTEDEVCWSKDGEIVAAAILTANQIYFFAPFDLSTPTLVVVSPQDNFNTYESSLIFSGYASDDKGVASARYRVNGGSWGALTLSGTENQFSQSVNLSEGSNSIEIEVFDTCGKSTTHTISGTYRILVSPPQVKLVSPVDLTTDHPQVVQIKWHSLAEVNSYHLQLSQNAQFSTFVLNDTALTDTFRVAGGLLDGASYYWRVRAKNQLGYGPFSATWQFISKPLVNVTSPAAGANWFANKTAEVRWISPRLNDSVDIWMSVDGGTTYPIALAENIDNDGSEYITVSDQQSNSGVIRVQAATNASHYGISDGLFNIKSHISQVCPLPAGWNMVSSFVSPQDPALQSLLAGISGTLTMMKNGQGQVYWPALDINQIVTWKMEHGYQLYLDSEDTLVIEGPEIIPESTTLGLAAGWNITSYLRNTPIGIETALASITTNLVIVKSGNARVYWPAYEINTIGEMQPGQGYQIYVTAPSTLTYPANNFTSTAAKLAIQQPAVPVHYTSRCTNSGVNATLLISTIALPDGAEIGAWTAKQLLVGSGVVTHSKAFLSLWGDDVMTPVIDGAVEGEPLSFTCWLPEDDRELLIYCTSLKDAITQKVLSSTPEYVSNAVWLAEMAATTNLVVESDLPDVSGLQQNYPNPFNPTTTIRYRLPHEARIEIVIYNLSGARVKTLANGIKQAGQHEVLWDGRDDQYKLVPSGIYWVKMIEGDFEKTLKMSLVK